MTVSRLEWLDTAPSSKPEPRAQPTGHFWGWLQLSGLAVSRKTLKMGTSKRMLEAAKRTLQKERKNYPGRWLPSQELRQGCSF